MHGYLVQQHPTHGAAWGYYSLLTLCSLVNKIGTIYMDVQYLCKYSNTYRYSMLRRVAPVAAASHRKGVKMCVRETRGPPRPPHGAKCFPSSAFVFLLGFASSSPGLPCKQPRKYISNVFFMPLQVHIKIQKNVHNGHYFY